MYNTMWKKLNLSCFSKFKCLALPPPPNEDDEMMPLSMSNNSVTSDDHEPSPDMATVLASQRFFFSSPGRSNSIVESGPAPPLLLDGGVAVPTYSPDPYADFRRSMQEMIEAREEASDWDYLHQLLLCYLTLNDKHTHKIIVRAFSDLLVTLLSSPSSLSNHNLRTSASLEYKTKGNMDVL